MLLAVLTLIFLLVCVTLQPFGMFAETSFSVPVLIALLVCLIPTTIGGLLSAIGISGIDRLIRRNVMATSGSAVEAAGDVDVLLLDKTGTITLGNRQATAFIPAPGVTTERLADAAQLASLADETPEGRSIVVLAKEQFNLRAPRRGRAARQVRSVHGANPDERRRFSGPRRPAGPSDPQGRAGCDPQVCREPEQFDPRHRVCRALTTSRDPAERRSPSPRTARSSASFISRTSSRAASRSGSRNFGGWASGPS